MVGELIIKRVIRKRIKEIAGQHVLPGKQKEVIDGLTIVAMEVLKSVGIRRAIKIFRELNKSENKSHNIGRVGCGEPPQSQTNTTDDNIQNG